MCRRFVSGICTGVASGATIGGLVVRKRRDQRYPHICDMTGFAKLGSFWMRRRFIRSCTCAIMTPRTTTRLPRYGTVIEQDLQPIGGVVTHIAGLGGGYVCRAFAGSDGAIMAVFTYVRGLAVIDWYYVRLPTRTRCVTSLAQIRGYRMGGRFVGGIGASMTCRTTVGGLVVGKWDDQRYPHIHRMAEFAGIGGLRMCRRFVSGICTGMASGATIGGLVVRKRRDQRHPYICDMTGFTQFRGLWMCRGFISSGTGAIMAPRAVTRLPSYCAVIKQDLQPIGGVVADIASLCCRYMRWTFSRRNRAIMTVFAQICSMAMIDRYYIGLPSRTSGMTDFAQIRGYRMSGGFVGGIGAIVTGRTRISGLIVGKRRDKRYPHICDMTRLTSICGDRMSRRLTDDVNATMASAASI